MQHPFRLLLTAVLLLWTIRASADAMLPIHIGDSHAASFYALAAGLRQDEACTLLLFDAHDDAMAIPGSDAIRKKLAKTAIAGTRENVFDNWRRKGVIQCFNWIEPLMPGRIARVVWVPPGRPCRRRRGALARTAKGQLDLFEDILPRECRSLAPRLRVAGLDRQEKESWLRDGRNGVVVSIDLDFFGDIPEDRLSETFSTLWRRVMEIRNLRAVTFAVSAPWQRDRERAERLLCLALEAAGAVANARIRFEPFERFGPDRSKKAASAAASGTVSVSIDLKTASPRLRTTLLSLKERLVTRYEPERLARMMRDWSTDAFLPGIVPVGRTIDPDGRLRFQFGQNVRLRVKNPGGGTVRWFAMVPGRARFNVFGDGYGFAEGAGAQVYRVRRPLGEGASIGVESMIPVLDHTAHAGTVLLFAEIERDGDVWRTEELEVAVRGKGLSGFRASLSELFARPYVFGAGLLKRGEKSGPDLVLGADCSTFLIDGLRRAGRILHWTDAAGLFRQLEPVAERRTLRDCSSIRLNGEDIEVGLFVFLGRHIAALWEDRPPKGILDPGDFLMHQLEGYPELIELKDIMRNRTWLEVARIPESQEDVRLLFGGDVMLGRGVGERIASGGFDPFSDIGDMFRNADLSVVTLESLPTSSGTASPQVKYAFRAPVAVADILANAGIDAVSLANNHALDFGAAGLEDGLARLWSAGIRCLGAGGGDQVPVRFTRKGVPFSLFACADFPVGDKVFDEPKRLVEALRKEQGRSFPVVLIHWGEEHTADVTWRQRKTAAMLVSAGAKLIVGCGPHVVQEMTVLNDVPVAWSLGNLVFDGPGPGPGWRRGMLFDVCVTRAGRCSRVEARFVSIAPDGKASLEGRSGNESNSTSDDAGMNNM